MESEERKLKAENKDRGKIRGPPGGDRKSETGDRKLTRPESGERKPERKYRRFALKGRISGAEPLPFPVCPRCSMDLSQSLQSAFRSRIVIAKLASAFHHGCEV